MLGSGSGRRPFCALGAEWRPIALAGAGRFGRGLGRPGLLLLAGPVARKAPRAVVTLGQELFPVGFRVIKRRLALVKGDPCIVERQARRAELRPGVKDVVELCLSLTGHWLPPLG